MKVVLLSEALEPHQQDEVAGWDSPDLSFSDHAFGHPNQMRVHVPLQPPKSQHEPDIAAHLEKHGYRLDDYHKGLVTDKHGRQQKLGKVLQKTDAHELLERYSTDPSRAGGSGIHQDHHVVISRHPYDVAGMTSKGHSWEEQSCMNFDTGSNRHYLPHEVKAGTHVAYLTHKDDHNIERPVARIAIKPFHGQSQDSKSEPHTILRREERVYGNAPDSFHATVDSWIHKHFPAKDNHIYERDPNVYRDSDQTYEFGKAALQNALYHSDNAVRSEAASSPSITGDHIHHYVTNSDHAKFHVYTARTLVSNPAIQERTVDHLVEAAKGARDKPSYLRSDRSHKALDMLDTMSSSYDSEGKAYSEGVNDKLWDHAVSTSPPENLMHFGQRKNISDKIVGGLLASSTAAGHELANNKQLKPHHIDKILEHVSDDQESVSRYSTYSKLASSHNVQDRHVQHMLSKIYPAPGNPNAAPWESTLHKPHSRIWFAKEVAKNDRIAKKHVDTLLASRDPQAHLGVSAVANRLSPKHVNQLLDHAISSPDRETYSTVLGNIAHRARLNSEHVDKLVDHISNVPVSQGSSYITSPRHNIAISLLANSEARTTPAHLLKIAGSVGPSIAQHVAEHPAATPETISKIIEHHPNSHMGIAMSSANLTEDHYNALKATRSGVMGLGARGSLPEHHLDDLVSNHSHDDEVIAQLAIHPKVRAHHLETLVGKAEHLDTVAQLANVVRHHFGIFGKSEDEPSRSRLGTALLNKAQPKHFAALAKAGFKTSLMDIIRPAHAPYGEIHKMLDIHAAHRDSYSHLGQGADYRSNSEGMEHWLTRVPSNQLHHSHINKFIDTHPDASATRGMVSNILLHAQASMSPTMLQHVHDHVQKHGGSGWRSALSMLKSDYPDSSFGKMPNIDKQ